MVLQLHQVLLVERVEAVVVGAVAVLLVVRAAMESFTFSTRSKL